MLGDRARGGRVTPDDSAWVWLEDLDPDRLFYTERIVLEKLRLGMSPWETGRGQPLADAAIMSIAPVGVVNAANPAQAYQDAFCVASIHQDGLERDAAATAAAGFAAAFAPGATVGSVLETMQELSTQEVGRLLSMGMDLARGSGTVEGFVEGFYATMLDRSFPVSPGEEWDKDRSPGSTSREVLPAEARFVLGDTFEVHECVKQNLHQCVIPKIHNNLISGSMPYSPTARERCDSSG